MSADFCGDYFEMDGATGLVVDADLLARSGPPVVLQVAESEDCQTWSSPSAPVLVDPGMSVRFRVPITRPYCRIEGKAVPETRTCWLTLRVRRERPGSHGEGDATPRSPEEA